MYTFKKKIRTKVSSAMEPLRLCQVHKEAYMRSTLDYDTLNAAIKTGII
ncbi:unnamed protein product [Arabidopsis halleri]